MLEFLSGLFVGIALMLALMLQVKDKCSECNCENCIT